MFLINIFLLFGIHLIPDVKPFYLTVGSSLVQAIYGNNTFTLSCSFTTSWSEDLYFIELHRKRPEENWHTTIATFVKDHSISYQDTTLQNRVVSSWPSSGNQINLVFSSVLCNDKAQYTWKATCYSQTVVSFNKTLDLLVRANTIFSSDGAVTHMPSTNIQEEDEVVFTCSGDVGNEPVGQLGWFYYLNNNTNIPHNASSQATPSTPVYRSSTCSYTRTSVLRLVMTKNFNNIIVRCTVQQDTYDQFGEGYKQTSNINVYYSPRVSSLTGADEAEEGHSITFSCAADSNPPSRYYWVLPDGNVTVGASTVLANLTVNDSGDYVCVAYNEFMSVNHSMSATKTLLVRQRRFSLILVFTERMIVSGQGVTVLTCAVNQSGFESVLIMQIMITLGNTLVNLGTLTSTGLIQTIPAGLTNRMKIDGTLDSNTPANSRLELTLDKENVQCSDATQYHCFVTYLSNRQGRTATANATLEVYVNPVILSLFGRVNGQAKEGSTENNKATAKVGDEIEISCTANVGSVSSNNIQWRKSSDLTQSEYWNEYQPPPKSSVVTDPEKHECSFVKTATLIYSLAESDASKTLGFECYVRAENAPYDGQETSHNPRFYVEVVTDGNNQAAIIGGVVGAVTALMVAVVAGVVVFFKRKVLQQPTVHEQRDESEAQSSTSQYEELNDMTLPEGMYSSLNPVTQSSAVVAYDNTISGTDTNIYSPTSQYEKLNSIILSTSGSTYASLQSASRSPQPADAAW